MRTLTVLLALVAMALPGCTGEPTSPEAAALPIARAAAVFPDVIDLPDGFWPEGIDFGRGTTFYVGSIATGAIFRGDARTGTGALLVSPQEGIAYAGVRYDRRGDRLFVAEAGGEAHVYDASSGARLATYVLADPEAGPTLVNDAVVLRDAAYFTDSFRPVIYRLPLDRTGALPHAGAVETIPLRGDFEFVPDTEIGNGNGIVSTHDEKRLIVANTTTGRLYLVDPRSGWTMEIGLGDATLPGADGLLLIGRTLYVVQGDLNQVAVVRLAPDAASGVVERTISDPGLDFPSTIAGFGNSLYAVNARFHIPAAPDVAYSVVRLPR